MRLRVRNVSTIICILGALICWALLIFFPAVPRTTAGWLALVFVGIPLLIGAEVLGDWLFDRPFLKQWSPSARIAYGVVILLATIVVLLPALTFTAWLIAP